MKSEKKKILFLCTGNCCRSQIAEGWSRHLKNDIFDVYSAGVSPGNEVNTIAIRVMAESGIDISSQRPKHLDTLQGIDFDYVVTLCDNANKTCPVFPGKAKVIHNSFYDPSFMPGSEEEILEAFRKLRDDIRTLVENMPENLEGTKEK